VCLPHTDDNQLSVWITCIFIVRGKIYGEPFATEQAIEQALDFQSALLFVGLVEVLAAA
jgi:hypothetical protein